MKKRTDYINLEGTSKATPNEETDNINLGFSAAMASGNEMQTSAHSIGLLFEQSVTQQNNQFQLSNTSAISGVRHLLKNPLNINQDLFSNLNAVIEEDE